MHPEHPNSTGISAEFGSMGAGVHDPVHRRVGHRPERNRGVSARPECVNPSLRLRNTEPVDGQYECHPTRTLEAPHGFPTVGAISSDRVAIFGREGYAFLFGGSTGYFSLYGRRGREYVAEYWCGLLERRQNRYAAHAPVVSLFVPNKTTCLPDLYPVALPSRELDFFAELRRLQARNPTALFGDALRRLSQAPMREVEPTWKFADTHWTSTGTIHTLNEVLGAFGLAPVPVSLEAVEPRRDWGDLTARWPDSPMVDWIRARYRTDLPDPVLEFDLLPPGVTPTVVSGRRITWRNPDAANDAHLLVVGNSYCGPATDQCQLNWWFGRLFRKLTFVHSGSIPSDTVESINPDLIFFQQVERFLPTYPDDSLTLADIESSYTSRLPS